MKQWIVIAWMLFALIPGARSEGPVTVNREQLEALLTPRSDTTYVVNFWATWCSPCVKELPHFEDLHRSLEGQNVRVILVNLDFPGQYDRRVVPFLQEKEITADVLQMTDLNYNEWIDRVDPSWSGAIPATLILNGGKRLFFEQELSRNELFSHVQQIRN
ncbi:MAG: TlpA family protein disulfide reductase [Bacteroidales bacterium]